jgi:hypothetical protein
MLRRVSYCWHRFSPVTSLLLLLTTYRARKYCILRDFGWSCRCKNLMDLTNLFDAVKIKSSPHCNLTRSSHCSTLPVIFDTDCKNITFVSSITMAPPQSSIQSYFSSSSSPSRSSSPVKPSSSSSPTRAGTHPPSSPTIPPSPDKSWVPEKDYTEVDIESLVPGPQSIKIQGRIVNFFDLTATSKNPRGAKGCIKIIVKDDTAAMTVK